jgi:hypothetical protein
MTLMYVEFNDVYLFMLHLMAFIYVPFNDVYIFAFNDV